MRKVKFEFDRPFGPPFWISAIMDFPIENIFNKFGSLASKTKKTIYQTHVLGINLPGHFGRHLGFSDCQNVNKFGLLELKFREIRYYNPFGW